MTEEKNIHLVHELPTSGALSTGCCHYISQIQKTVCSAVLDSIRSPQLPIITQLVYECVRSWFSSSICPLF